MSVQASVVLRAGVSEEALEGAQEDVPAEEEEEEEEKEEGGVRECGVKGVVSRF